RGIRCFQRALRGLSNAIMIAPRACEATGPMPTSSESVNAEAKVPSARHSDRCAAAFGRPEPARASTPCEPPIVYEADLRRTQFGYIPSCVECARGFRYPATAAVETSDKTRPNLRVFEAPSSPSQQHVCNSARPDKACRCCCEIQSLEIALSTRAASPA